MEQTQLNLKDLEAFIKGNTSRTAGTEVVSRKEGERRIANVRELLVAYKTQDFVTDFDLLVKYVNTATEYHQFMFRASLVLQHLLRDINPAVNADLTNLDNDITKAWNGKVVANNNKEQENNNNNG